jgi:hypothetical protein
LGKFGGFGFGTSYNTGFFLNSLEKCVPLEMILFSENFLISGPSSIPTPKGGGLAAYGTRPERIWVSFFMKISCMEGRGAV